MTLSRRILVCFLMLSLPSIIYGQGMTGSLTGSVTSDNAPLAGVTVTVTSAALQGARTAITGDAGGFLFPALPAGDYTVTYELEGMQKVTRKVKIDLAQSTRADAELRVSGIAEALTVTASAPSVLETPQVATSFAKEQIDNLPVDRSITDTVLLAPGVNDGGPNDQIIISGAQSFDSLFLVNGVVVNENLRGQPQNLFIEDAIQETSILRGAVSAEYGRFTGGVVTTVTKAGGNEFSASLRDSLTNSDWVGKTPFAAEADHIDQINHRWEATAGGRILRDRIWFFAAGLKRDSETSAQTTQTNIPYTQEDKQTRWEAKLTGMITPRHDLVGSYIKSDRSRTNVTSGRMVDLASLANRKDPNSLLSLHYGGVLTNNLLVEAQFSHMNFSFTQGAETRDLIMGTLLLDAASGNRGWSPTFCGEICPPKERDNRSLQLKGNYFLSTRATGNHSIVVGGEDFHQLRNENNYQSGSDFRIHGNFFFDGTKLYFGVDPTRSEIEWDPVPALSKTSDFGVMSYFVNDKWDLSSKWAFNVGLRYDKASGKDQAGNKTVDDSAFSPRLSASFDPLANGRHRIVGSYSRYVSKVDQGPADNTATAGRYASYYWDYKGPEINPRGTPFGQMVPVEEVIRRVFEWFNSVGGTKNTQFLTSARIPGVTTQFERSLKAPSMDEITLGYGLSLGRGGYIRADLITRDWQDFYVVRRTRETGKTRDANGTLVDIGFIENSSDNLERTYNAVQLQGAQRLFSRWELGGNYTWSKLRGNVEGESASFATTLTDYKNYPEYTDFEQNRQIGYLAADMRHRANVWLGYTPNLGFGDLNISLLHRFHSGLPYSAVSTIDVRQSTTLPNGIVNPGYERPPTAVTYFFSERGAYRLDDIHSTDLAFRYTIPVGGQLGLTLFADVLNVMDNDGVEDPDVITTTVRTRRNGANFGVTGAPAARAFNPFTETPVEGTHFLKDVNFGKPTNIGAYQNPRTYRFALRLRF